MSPIRNGAAGRAGLRRAFRRLVAWGVGGNQAVGGVLSRFVAALGLLSAAYGAALAADGQAPRFVDAIAALQETAGHDVLASVMPATPVKVVATRGAYIEVEIAGWSPMGGAKYLFKDIGQRITLALLTDAGVGRRVVAGTKDDAWGSTWEGVKITGWIEQKDVAPDVDAIWQKASKLYYSRCSRCHSLRRPREFTANQWPSVLKIMTVRAGFSSEQAALVTALLQDHAKDQNGDDFFTRSAAPPPAAPSGIPKIVGTPELAAKGAALFQSASCAACHGEDAKTPIMSEYPKLAGQSPEYLDKQILDFKAGARSNDPNSVMKEAVSPLSEGDAQAIAYWLSKQ